MSLTLRERVVEAIAAAPNAKMLQDATVWQNHHKQFKDLDIWCPSTNVATLKGLLEAAGCHCVDQTQHSLRFCAADETGVAVVDVAVGVLRVGLFEVLAEQHVSFDDKGLSGVALVCDQLWRPLAVGKIPSRETIAATKAAWADADESVKQSALSAFPKRLATVLGNATASGNARTIKRAMHRLFCSNKARSMLELASQHRIGHATRFVVSKAVSKQERGVLIVVVGVDGSGKSTLVADTTKGLNEALLATVSVYCGSVRENSALVSYLRKFSQRNNRQSSGPAKVQQLTISRRFQLILLAADGIWRYWTRVRPLLKQGANVVCDRWMCDLRLEPQPGWPALAAVAERFVGRPNVAVLADPPVDVIARRSTESPLQRASLYQATYRVWLDRQHVSRQVRCDTSSHENVPSAAIVAAVVAAKAAPIDPSHTTR